MSKNHVFRIRLENGVIWRNKVYTQQNTPHGIISQLRLRNAKVEALRLDLVTEYVWVPECDRVKIPRFY